MPKKDDFFIGWSDETPKADRRTFAAAGIASLGLLAGAGGLLAHAQRPVGPGMWDQGDIREWRGIVTSHPFPMLRFLREDGTTQTALLACMGKCAVKPMLDSFGDKEVIVRGSPIVRGPFLMIATADDGSWITPAEGVTAISNNPAFPAPLMQGEAKLKGRILDTKCWFGAMRPGEGKGHKACASLCIRGGLAPGFYVKSIKQQSQLLILVDEVGRPHGEGLLPFVADPIEVSGVLTRLADFSFYQVALSTIKRL